MTDRLLQVFEHKAKSSMEFREVQRKHGLLLAPENLRADPGTREGCIELHKGIHWFNLELQEFLTVSTDDKPEELADVLHFLVELAILFGYDHTIVPIEAAEEDEDRLSVMLLASANNPFVMEDADTNARFAIIAGLHVAELLKNKPWKQTLKPVPDPKDLRERVQAMFYWYGAVVRTAGLTAQQLFDQFTRKDEINHERVTSGV